MKTMEIFTPQFIVLTVVMTMLATAGCSFCAALLVNGLAKAGRYFGSHRRPSLVISVLRPRWTAPARDFHGWRVVLRLVAMRTSFLVLTFCL